jgi:hypothetical protein
MFGLKLRCQMHALIEIYLQNCLQSVIKGNIVNVLNEMSQYLIFLVINAPFLSPSEVKLAGKKL